MRAAQIRAGETLYAVDVFAGVHPCRVRTLDNGSPNPITVQIVKVDDDRVVAVEARNVLGTWDDWTEQERRRQARREAETAAQRANAQRAAERRRLALAVLADRIPEIPAAAAYYTGRPVAGSDGAPIGGSVVILDVDRLAGLHPDYPAGDNTDE